jgi:hypothetical protein
VVPVKVMDMDMVAVRHCSSGAELRTSLILLCEDGSLRIYMAGQEHTSFWLRAQRESVAADRKLALTLGPSQDPDCVTMLDSLLVYGKSKDAFGWPEEAARPALLLRLQDLL